MKTWFYLGENNVFIMVRAKSNKQYLKGFNNDKKLREIFQIPPNKKFKNINKVNDFIDEKYDCDCTSSLFWFTYKNTEPCVNTNSSDDFTNVPNYFFDIYDIDLCRPCKEINHDFSFFDDTFREFVGMKTKLISYNIIEPFNVFLLGEIKGEIRLQKSLFDINTMKIIKEYL